jgi:hypothetical protein
MREPIAAREPAVALGPERGSEAVMTATATIETGRQVAVDRGRRPSPRPPKSRPRPAPWVKLALGATALVAFIVAIALATGTSDRRMHRPAGSSQVEPAERGALAEMPDDPELPEAPDRTRVLDRLRQLDASACGGDSIAVTIVVHPDGRATSSDAPECVRDLLEPLRFGPSRRGLVIRYER